MARAASQLDLESITVAKGVVPLARVGGVIRGKVMPEVVGGWVERPRPEGVLVRALVSRPVVVVSAMAGSGKTTLVAAVTQRLGWPVAWLTLDWTDNAPGRLVMYLEAALAVAVPGVEGVVRGALVAGVPHSEAAGLLVEAVGGRGVVLVVDELERLGEGSEAWAVIEAVLRHAPADMRFVLCSRRPVPTFVLPSRPGDVGRLGDEVLALTVEEAAEVLAGLGRPAVDPVGAVRATGGWMTGVLFEAWRLGEQAGGGGPGDPLYDYLAAQILGRLAREDGEFLIATSVLDEVSAARATALGVQDAGARLASLRRAHIPAAWGDGGRTLCCHPRFRECLQDCLESWDAERVEALQVAHGRLLAGEGRDEEATEVLLGAGAVAEALEPAARAIFAVMDRLDFTLAARWLDALAEVVPGGVSPFVIARLRLAVAREDHAAGVELADRLAARGKLTEVASSSSAAAWMLGQCYLMAGRYDDMLAVCALAPHDPGYQGLRVFLAIVGSEPPPALPALTGGPLDSLMLPIIYGYGHLATALEIEQARGWVQAFSQPWVVAALAGAGRLREAVDLLEAVRAHGSATALLEGVVAARVLTDAGRRGEALEAIARGRRLARTGPSVIWELLAGVEEARLRLRIDRDPVAALVALDPVDVHPITHRIGFLAPTVDSWYGFALLLAGRDAEATERLRRSVAAQQRTGRVLELPATAVYLAEAEWRIGNEDAADQAADLALEAACAQGFNHMLLSALRDVPAVLSRRLDAEPGADSRWHEIARALRAHGLETTAPVRATVQLLEFGRCAILLDGQEVCPKITKAYELLAYLLSRPQHRAERNELLDALFDSRADDSTRSYLRQAVCRLRAVLSPDAITTASATVALGDQLAATSESAELERALAEAARLQGSDRLAGALAALQAFDRGPYLPAITSHWADERRQHLHELATDARYDAAELAFSTDQPHQARTLTDAVLQAEPYHEPAWRLAMRLDSACGDHQGVLRSYQRCERLLAEIGAQPSNTTRQLIHQLRR
jgi:DNA-binding SARP family transcriptional activator